MSLIDGAVCLRSSLVVLPQQGIMLDFYYLGEHVIQAAGMTPGLDTPASQDWRG